MSANEIRRAAEILLVLDAIYGKERISDTSDIEQVRPVTRGHEADTGSARICLPYLRKDPYNRPLGDRPPACQEL